MSQADNPHSTIAPSAAAKPKAKRIAFGLARAERELEATGEAELEAAIAVCAYPCATLEEARIKAEYLARAPGLSDGLQEEQVEALLQSFSKVAA